MVKLFATRPNYEKYKSAAGLYSTAWQSVHYGGSVVQPAVVYTDREGKKDPREVPNNLLNDMMRAVLKKE